MPRNKVSTSVDARKYLNSVPEDKVFWSHDGAVLHNMAELSQALNGISNETFAYHVNPEKNDFANWVKDVIGDGVLATHLFRSLDRESAAKQVSERLKVLQRKLPEATTSK
jgi:hypothetical protein